VCAQHTNNALKKYAVISERLKGDARLAALYTAAAAGSEMGTTRSPVRPALSHNQAGRTDCGPGAQMGTSRMTSRHTSRSRMSSHNIVSARSTQKSSRSILSSSRA
jgi:hypothetical protein